MLNLEEYADYTNSKLDQPRYYLQPNGEMRYVFSGNESAYQADPNNPELYKVITYRNWQKKHIHQLSHRSTRLLSVEELPV